MMGERVTRRGFMITTDVIPKYGRRIATREELEEMLKGFVPDGYL